MPERISASEAIRCLNMIRELERQAMGMQSTGSSTIDAHLEIQARGSNQQWRDLPLEETRNYNFLVRRLEEYIEQLDVNGLVDFYKSCVP